MKIKIVGFKVGLPRPTYNKTLDLENDRKLLTFGKLGVEVAKALDKSDFLSIRRVV